MNTAQCNPNGWYKCPCCKNNWMVWKDKNHWECMNEWCRYFSWPDWLNGGGPK